MKKKFCLFVLIFGLFFFFENDVKAQSGMICSYSGKKSTNCTTPGNQGTPNYQGADSMNNGAGNCSEDFPYTFTLKVYCANKSCKSLSVEHYGLIKSAQDTTREFSPNNSVQEVVNSDKSKFGFKSGEGVSKCPDSIALSYPTVAKNKSNLLIFHEFAFEASGNESHYVSKDSFQKFSSSKDVDVKSYTEDVIAGKTPVVHGGGNGNNDAVTKKKEDETVTKAAEGKNVDSIDDIRKVTKDKYTQDVNYDDMGCHELLGDGNIDLISKGFMVIAAAGVIILIVLGATDFVKVITAGDDDGLATAFKKIKNRIISVIILLLLPVIIDLFLNLLNDNFTMEENGKGNTEIKIGSVQDCYESKS